MSNRYPVVILSAAALMFFQERPPQRAVNDLSGEFYKGDGLGVNRILNLDGKGRFSFEFAHDVGLSYENKGTVEVVEGRLALRPEHPDSHRAMATTSKPDLLLIPWGKRLYLIEEGELLGFCNAVNLGAEPRSAIQGRFYLRILTSTYVWRIDGDVRIEGKRVPDPALDETLPPVPKEWEPFLLKKPILGAVTAAENVRTIRINLGTRDGVRKGMELWVNSDGYGFVTVLAAEERTCTAEIKWTVFDRISDYKVGQAVYSKIPAHLDVLAPLLFNSFMNPKADPP